MAILKLGNMRDLLKECYKKGHHFNHNNCLNEDAIKMEDRLVGLLPSKTSHRRSSWFHYPSQFDWHKDGRGSYSMIIATWPTATEIQVSNTKVFQPDPGDIYYLNQGLFIEHLNLMVVPD